LLQRQSPINSRNPPAASGPAASGPDEAGQAGSRLQPRPDQILPGFLQQVLGLNPDQQKQIDELQKEVDAKIGKILTDEQQKQCQAARGRPGGMAPPGQVLSSSQRARLKPSDAQAKQIDGLQKEVEDRLAKILTDEQHKQVQNMRQVGRGHGGFGGPGGFGGAQRPPDAVFRLQLYRLNRVTGTILWQQTAYEGKPRIPT
jgi:hypothetical protein